MIFVSKSVVHFQTRCGLKFFLPYGPMLTKTKKKNVQHLKFRQSLYKLDRDPPWSMHEFWGVNLLRTFRGNVV